MKKQTAHNSYIKYSGMGVQMILIILIGVWGGQKLDQFWQLENPIFTAILALVSVIIAIVWMIASVYKHTKQQ